MAYSDALGNKLLGLLSCYFRCRKVPYSLNSVHEAESGCCGTDVAVTSTT